MEKLYCEYTEAIQAIPQEVLDQNKKEVNALLNGLNQRIREYDTQYQVLLKELGVLCSAAEKNQDSIHSFFNTINDFLQLGLSTNERGSENYKVYESLVDKMTNKLYRFEQASPLEKALLVQITKSAWALTNPDRNMKQVAKQNGGKLKKKTRKARRV